MTHKNHLSRAAAALLCAAVLLFCGVFGAPRASALSAQPDVILNADCTVSGDPLRMTGRAEVLFNNTVLINDSLKLSYHISDSYGTLIEYEGVRIPLVFEGNTAAVDVNVLLPDGLRKDDLRIDFDIIDEQNLYWFSTDPVMYFDTTTIGYVYDPFSYFAGLYRGLVTGQPLQLAANLLFWALTVWLIVRLRKATKQRRAAFAAANAAGTPSDGGSTS